MVENKGQETDYDNSTNIKETFKKNVKYKNPSILLFLGQEEHKQIARIGNHYDLFSKRQTCRFLIRKAIKQCLKEMQENPGAGILD